MNPQGNEWNHPCRKITKITSQAKDITRWHITIWYTNLFLCLKRWKSRMQRQQWTRNGRSSKRFRPGGWIKPKSKKYKGRVALWGDIVKDDSGAYAVLTQPRLICDTNDRRKSNRCHCWTTILWWTSSWRCISLHSGKIGGRSQIAHNSKVRMSRYMDTSSTTQMAQITGYHWRSSGSSRTKSVWSPTRRPSVGKTSQVSCVGAWMEKVPNWECLFVHRKQELFLSVYVDKMAGKKQNVAPMWKEVMKNVDPDEPTSFLDNVDLGCTQRECKPNEICYRAIQRNVWITHFCWSWKITRMGIASRKDGCVDLRHGRTCSNMRWHCELVNNKTEQLYKVSSPCLGDHQFKKEELESIGELPKVCSQIVLKCLFHGQWITLLDQSPNGHKLVTDVWQDQFHTFITEVTTDSIVIESTSGGILHIFGCRTFCLQ